MPDFSDQNLFQMFVANGHQPGFWLRRTTWGESCARVTSVGPLTGPEPYYGNPKVHADIYNLTTGELREANAPARRQYLQDLAADRRADLGGSCDARQRCSRTAWAGDFWPDSTGQPWVLSG